MSTEHADESKIEKLKELCNTFKTAENTAEVVKQAVELFGARALFAVASQLDSSDKAKEHDYVKSECEKLLAA